MSVGVGPDPSSSLIGDGCMMMMVGDRWATPRSARVRVQWRASRSLPSPSRCPPCALPLPSCEVIFRPLLRIGRQSSESLLASLLGIALGTGTPHPTPVTPRRAGGSGVGETEPGRPLARPSPGARDIRGFCPGIVAKTSTKTSVRENSPIALLPQGKIISAPKSHGLPTASHARSRSPARRQTYC